MLPRPVTAFAPTPSLDGDATTLVKEASNGRRAAYSPHPDDQRAAVDETGRTLLSGDTNVRSSAPAEVDLGPAPLDQPDVARYEARALLGEGGMGEVHLCRDERIGREVAMKVIRPGGGSRSDARARFVREARVQGQLEHPSIVPVYDLGVNPDGAAFFTMKRVRGETLQEVVEKLAEGDPAAAATHTRRKLLGAFSSVCLAVAFAHARGVLHRDLKPGNIMLGAYGELYVLDWGLAKLRGAADPEEDRGKEGAVEAPLSRRHQTAAGAMLGTPGYMSPEQILGDLEGIDERTDVYALGAILFEILTLTPLHGRPGDRLEALLASTLQGADARASTRAPEAEVPPELEAICVRATMKAARDRFAGAREMSEAIERFLDGDRDLEHRNKVAEEHARKAAELLTSAGSRETREAALREVGAALALNPGHRGAKEAMMRLLLEASAELPAEARAEFEAQSKAIDGVTRRGMVIAYSTYLLMAPALFCLGVRDYRLLGLVMVLAALAPAVAWWVSRSAPGERKDTSYLAVFVTSTLFISASSLFMGPFILVPSMITSNTIAFVAFGERRHRPIILSASVLALVVPLLLQAAGAMPTAYAFSADGMLVVPRLVSFPAAATQGFLLVANLMLVLIPALTIARVRDSLAKNEERVFAHAYNLRQLLPSEARGVGIPALATDIDECERHLALGLRWGRHPERRKVKPSPG